MNKTRASSPLKMNMMRAVLPPSTRDLRIDFTRGGALLIIYSDHIRGNFLAEYTLFSIGLADMAEVFVFLSGYVGGIVYGRILVRDGFWACQRKALFRVLQIYVANLLGIVALIGILMAWERAFPVPAIWRDRDIVGGTDEIQWCHEFTSRAGSSWSNLLQLREEPVNFAILPLYMIFLSLLPVALTLCCRSPAILIGISLLLYLAVQRFSATLCLGSPWRESIVFNPFAWQLLFVCGAVLGPNGYGKLEKRWQVKRSWLILVTITAVLGLSMPLILEYCYGIDPRLFPFASKGILQPLRLVYFFCMCWVASFLPAANHALWKSRAAWPVVLCGQNALVAFSAGAILSSIATLILPFVQYDIVWQIAINLLGWVLCCLAAYVASRWRPFQVKRLPKVEHKWLY